MAEERIVRVVRAVQRGVQWLKNSVDQNWEPSGVAATISALVSAERNQHSQFVQRLVRCLEEQQRDNGSWNDELWDTAHVLRALIDVGQAQTSTVQRALRFFKLTQDSLDGTWYEDLSETILVVDLLRELDPENFVQDSGRALNWIASLQRKDGLIVGMRYTGMAVSLFKKLIGTNEELQPVVGRAVASLVDAINERGIWTSASWSNYYPLRALLDMGFSLDDAPVARAVDWFLDHQEESGRWMQVAEVHDTAMAVWILTCLLSAPLIDVTPPHVAVLQVNRENGTLRVAFLPPGAGTILPSERMKLSESVRSELGMNQQRLLAAIGRTRSLVRSPQAITTAESESQEEFVKKVGQYTYGHLIPARIQVLMEDSNADHLRLDVDERLIDLPWELIHDGRDYLCLRYASGRRLISDQPVAVSRVKRSPNRQRSALVVANPTEDLPAAEIEGARVAELLRANNLKVDFLTGRAVRKKEFLLSVGSYDIVHFAGHASHNAENPDESHLLTLDGEIQAFEIGRFLKSPAPSVVFLNACWSAEELRNPEKYSPMMRGLGRTFMYAGVTAFIGYLVPVPDETATRFALEFYSSLTHGHSIGESIRRSRITVRERGRGRDLTWASAVLYGEPSESVFEAG